MSPTRPCEYPGCTGTAHQKLNVPLDYPRPDRAVTNQDTEVVWVCDLDPNHIGRALRRLKLPASE